MRTTIAALLVSALLPAPSFAAAPAAAPPVPPCCREIQPGTILTDRSVYQLDSEWTSDFGRRIRLGVLSGRPQVVAMFFTHCEYACPILVHDLRRIEQALPPDVRGKVDFLLVTMDHERDTPAVLREYRSLRRLPAERWTLLHGGAEAVRELAAVLGVNYRRDARGQYLHSNLVTLLDSRGEVVRQLTGLNQDITSFVTAIVETASN